MFAWVFNSNLLPEFTPSLVLPSPSPYPAWSKTCLVPKKKKKIHDSKEKNKAIHWIVMSRVCSNSSASFRPYSLSCSVQGGRAWGWSGKSLFWHYGKASFVLTYLIPQGCTVLSHTTLSAELQTCAQKWKLSCGCISTHAQIPPSPTKTQWRAMEAFSK